MDKEYEVVGPNHRPRWPSRDRLRRRRPSAAAASPPNPGIPLRSQASVAFAAGDGHFSDRISFDHRW